MRMVLIVAVLFGLAGCAPGQSVMGIGGGTDEYKESPCACGDPIPMPNRQAV